MSNALQMGIHEAEQRVRDMQDGQYHPVSLIRNLPLVGSVIGWFVPPGGEEKPRVSDHHPLVSWFGKLNFGVFRAKALISRADLLVNEPFKLNAYKTLLLLRLRKSSTRKRTRMMKTSLPLLKAIKTPRFVL